MKASLIMPLFLATCHDHGPQAGGTPADPANLAVSQAPDTAPAILLFCAALLCLALLWKFWLGRALLP